MTPGSARTTPPDGGRALRAVLYVVAATVILVDQVTKQIAVAASRASRGFRVLGELAGFLFHRNDGAAFGMGSGATWVFTVIALIVFVVILWAGRRAGFTCVGLGTRPAAGRAHGQSDRSVARPPELFHGAVVDFIDLYFFVCNRRRHRDHRRGSTAHHRVVPRESGWMDGWSRSATQSGTQRTRHRRHPLMRIGDPNRSAKPVRAREKRRADDDDTVAVRARGPGRRAHRHRALACPRPVAEHRGADRTGRGSRAGRCPCGEVRPRTVRCSAGCVVCRSRNGPRRSWPSRSPACRSSTRTTR